MQKISRSVVLKCILVFAGLLMAFGFSIGLSNRFFFRKSSHQIGC